MLNGIHIVDFGNHRNTRLTFGSMTALVGKNGSGKSTAMRAVFEAGLLAASRRDVPIDFSAFRRRGGRQEILAASWAGGVEGENIDEGLWAATGQQFFRRKRIPGEIEVWIPHSKAEIPSPERYPFPEPADRFAEPAGEERLQPGQILSWSGPIRWNCRYFKATGKVLQGPSYSEDLPPRIGGDGSNLSWSLTYLMTAHPDRFVRILESLREVVPIVRRIRARPVPVVRVEKNTFTINGKTQSLDQESTVMGQELIFDMLSGENLPATAVSEGTLMVLGVLTLLHGSESTDMIMLDDVELSLHPKAQRDLMRQLRRIQEMNPKLQIITSTHSPYVIDDLDPKDVWLFTTDGEGCAVSKQLSDHPDADRSLQVLTTGEFWSAEGESWVRDGGISSRVAEEPVR